jgi:deoxyribodipyrimidine photo-lyase
MTTTTLVWFRQDLRIKDNPALSWAAEQGPIIPIYILDTENCQQFGSGEASKWWLHHSLESLNKTFDGNLRIYVGDPGLIINKLISQCRIDNVVWNRCYEPWQQTRDKQIKKTLIGSRVNAKSFNASLLWEPMSITKGDGTPYKVFTPYYRNGCLRANPPRYPLPQPKLIRYADCTLDSVKICDLGLLPTLNWANEFHTHWSVGEEGAANQLSEFIANAAISYRDDRNIPSIKGTSNLSPHLHFGEISPNQAWYAVLDAFGGNDNENIYTYLSELGWREFSYYLLFHWPSLPTNNFNAKFDRFCWDNNKDFITAWQRGITGIPIIDAGMRELCQTGYMHNRVRMVVGSFLVKNLRTDWRIGERWFWDQLLDADLASNSAGWQWVAGSGADAAPYFRIFNPVLQGEKFDKQGDYVKRYCPELSNLPNKFIHKPWEASVAVLELAGVELGHDYPNPIVDLKISRQQALDAYKQIKE